MGVAFQVVVAGAGHVHPQRPTYDLTTRAELHSPTGGDQVVRLDGAGVTADQGCGPLELSPGQQDLAGVRIGRPGLRVAVVPVVPDRDQSAVVDRSIAGRPGADDPAPPSPRAPPQFPLPGPPAPVPA